MFNHKSFCLVGLSIKRCTMFKLRRTTSSEGLVWTFMICVVMRVSWNNNKDDNKQQQQQLTTSTTQNIDNIRGEVIKDVNHMLLNFERCVGVAFCICFRLHLSDHINITTKETTPTTLPSTEIQQKYHIYILSTIATTPKMLRWICWLHATLKTQVVSGHVFGFQPCSRGFCVQAKWGAQYTHNSNATKITTQNEYWTTTHKMLKTKQTHVLWLWWWWW